MIKRTILLSAIFLALLLAGGCERQPDIQASGKVIKLAIIGPFSGEDRAKGEDGLRGVRTAMSLSPMLQNGDKLELVIKDDKNMPSSTVSAINEAANEDQVSAVILMSTSASALKIRPVADELQLPVLAMLATHPDVTEDNNFVSQLCFDNITQGTVAALFVRDELLIDKVAVFINRDSQNSSDLAAEFIRKYQSVSGRVVDTVLVKPDVDYKAKLNDLRSKGTELLYMPVKAKDLFTIVQTARDIGWQPDIMGSDGLLATVISRHEEDKELLEGIYAIDFFTEKDTSIKTISFVDKISSSYKDLYKEKPTSYTALGLESYMIIQAAMNRCNDGSDRECINDMLRKTDDFDGLSGKVSINKNGKASRPLVINTIKNGHTKYVVKVY
ncbi:MAG: ABC transporter substrate-binding protein [Planctomycetia bacterium]|nr:ABC transporter substrate-binding protein [Planctomycetia bacterium]